MRCDDRIETILAWAPGDAAGRARTWTQLIDLIAQGGEADLLSRAIDRARNLRAHVSIEQRRLTAERAAQARASAALVAFFAEEADIARPLLATAKLTEPEWAALLPGLDQRARAILAARRDLPKAIAEALAPPAASQIVDLLTRIEAFQQERPEPAPTTEGFAFTIDGEGRFCTADGTALAARLGDAPMGVDGQAIGAWRAHMAMADARLEIETGAFAGVWRISASPIVDKEGGLLGYRGVARSPRVDEVAAPAAPQIVVGAESDDFLRAMDRLLDPLAALGEAELPGGDALPIAREVAEQGQALADAIGRFGEMAIQQHEAPLDMGGMLERLHGVLTPLAEARGLTLDFRIPRDLPAADVDPEALERMVTRLVTSIVPLGRRRERIVARLSRDREQPRRVLLTITRPGRLVAKTAEDLRDPSGEDAPMLALGFALRLVEKLAAEVGGQLTIADDRLLLSLPARAGQARRASANGDM